MMRWIPDWVVYALVLGVVLWVVFSGETDDAPPPPPEAIEQEGAMLPPPSAFDERVLVQVTAPKSGVGTAFAINGEGQWLTARHVVDGCNEIALLVAPGQYAPAARGLLGSLGGLSGGPVFDENGNVRGVIVAESARRGRIYTAAPEAVAEFIKATGADAMGGRSSEFSTDSYGEKADIARRNLQVVKVACSVDE